MHNLLLMHTALLSGAGALYVEISRDTYVEWTGCSQGAYITQDNLGIGDGTTHGIITLPGTYRPW